MDDQEPPQASVVRPRGFGSGGKVRYDELVRSPDLSAGVYDVPVGGIDRQEPHSEDEVYAVLRGRAVLDVDGRRHPVEEGTVAFVPAGVPHRFVDVEQDLRVLVFFGPAEHSRKTAPGGAAP